MDTEYKKVYITKTLTLFSFEQKLATRGGNLYKLR